MGRGDSANKAHRSAQSLLFGPRKGRHLAPERKRALGVERRKMKIQSRQRNYQQEFTDASQAFIDGDHEPLDQLLDAGTPKSTIGIEKKALRQTALEFAKALPRRSYSSRKSDQEPLPGRDAALDTLQKLRRRAIERGLPDSTVLSPLASASAAQAEMLVAERLTEEAKQNIEQIGPVPKMMISDYYWHPMGQDGNTLCGASPEENPRSGPCSILNSGSMYCDKCEKLLTEGKQPQMVEKDELLKEIEEVGILSNSGTILGWHDPRPDLNAEETLQLGVERGHEEIRQLFEGIQAEAPSIYRQ